MNLLHVVSSMDPRAGGPCQGIRNFAPETFERGNAMEVVCLDDPASDYFANESLTIHALGEGRGPWAYHAALQPWLDKNLSRFDAVILNGLWQYPGFAISRTQRRPGMPPYFLYPHGMLDPWFQRAPERRWKAIRNWIHWKIAERHVVHHARAVLFTCAEEMRLARETFRPYQPRQEVNVGFGIAQPPKYREGMAGAAARICPSIK